MYTQLSMVSVTQFYLKASVNCGYFNLAVSIAVVYNIILMEVINSSLYMFQLSTLLCYLLL